MMMGCPTRSAQPVKSGSPVSGSVPKQTNRARSSAGATPVPTGHRAKTHQSTVTARTEARATRAHTSPVPSALGSGREVPGDPRPPGAGADQPPLGEGFSEDMMPSLPQPTCQTKLSRCQFAK
jgi:hypothetical protein